MKKLLVVLVLLGLSLAGVAAWVSRSRQPANGEALFTGAARAQAGSASLRNAHLITR